MYLCKLFALYLLCYTCSGKKGGVLKLSDSKFETRIGKYEIALVMFYAPWCDHCKQLQPEFAKAAEKLIKNDPPINLFKVNCVDTGIDTCTKFQILHFPVLKIFRNGQFSEEYKGPREAKGMVEYMKAELGPNSKELTTVDELEAFVKADNDVSVIGFFDRESDLKAVFLNISEQLREKPRFAHSTNQMVLEKQGISDGLVLFRPHHLSNKFEDDNVTYSGAANFDEIKDFITENYYGLVGHRTPDNKQEFQNPLVVVYYDVDFDKNYKGTIYWRNRVLKVATQYKDKLNFAFSSKNDFQDEHKFDEGLEIMVMATDVDKIEFVMKDNFSVEAFAKFVQYLTNEKLKPQLKTEPVPKRNNGAVKIVVATTFDDMVINNGKDTLIAFYTPWCTQCQEVAPGYVSLAEKLKDEDVAIVKMDANANYVPPKFVLNDYPAVYWVPQLSKDKPVRYEDRLELNDVFKFIAKHASSELKGYDRRGNPKPLKNEL